MGLVKTKSLMRKGKNSFERPKIRRRERKQLRKLKYGIIKRRKKWIDGGKLGLVEKAEKINLERNLESMF